VLLVLVVAIAGGVAAFLLVHDSSSAKGGGAATTAPPASQATLSASDFDPIGGDGEDHAAVGNAVDGDPATGWRTEQYVSFPDGPKTGVGLALSLNGEFDVRTVTVATQEDGWGASIYVSDRPASELTYLADWGPVRAQGSDLASVHDFDTGGVRGRSVLVWITQMPVDANGKYSVEISEVRVA
jgi:hypothetical protein